jgi:putative ATPase
MPKAGENPLFAADESRGGQGMTGKVPLASRMRPRNLDEFFGQEHIVGPGRLLRRAIQKDQLSSILLSGPPGTGKTTLARIIANTTKSAFTALNAVLSGVGELREAIERAKRHQELYSLKTILFVDEVHRWNKSQQDALLPWVENGTVVLIGATTENPFFEVNRALVSRSRVFLLRSLTDTDLKKIAEMTLADKERGYGEYEVDFASGALEHLVRTADGDARSLLNALELAVETSAEYWPPEAGTQIRVSMEAAEESIQKKVVLYDKDGDYHYDTISAFIKSLRGSDPDAALYWLARMVYAGEDPSFIFRRMLISAAEDVGLADPEALRVVSSCAQAFDRIGMPEGQFHLGMAALYLATCKKSNSTLGYFDALKAVGEDHAEVPDHLKDASRDGASLGHGEGYKYPHAYKDHWTSQQYLPDSMQKNVFYFPGSLGVEGDRRSEVLERREAQLALAPSDLADIGPSARETAGAVWSEEGERRTKWKARAEGSASARLRSVRRAVFAELDPGRAKSLLVIDPRKGFYGLEAVRRVTDGTVGVILESQEARSQFERLVSDLPELSRPLASCPSPENSSMLDPAFDEAMFDDILVCEPFGAHAESFDLWSVILAAYPSFHKSGKGALHGFQIDARRSSRLCEVLSRNLPKTSAEDGALIAALRGFEEKFGMGPGYAASPSAVGDAALELKNKLGSVGIGCEVESRTLSSSYERRVSREEIAGWFSPGTEYGAGLRAECGASTAEQIKSLFSSCPERLEWPIYLDFWKIKTGQ